MLEATDLFWFLYSHLLLLFYFFAVLCELGSGHIETVLLSVPEDKRSWSDIQPIWEAMEDYVDQEKIFSLGVSDLNGEQLEELYNAAKVCKTVIAGFP